MYLPTKVAFDDKYSKLKKKQRYLYIIPSAFYEVGIIKTIQFGDPDRRAPGSH